MLTISWLGLPWLGGGGVSVSVSVIDCDWLTDRLDSPTPTWRLHGLKDSLTQEYWVLTHTTLHRLHAELSCCQLSVVSFFLFLSNAIINWLTRWLTDMMIEVVLVDLKFTRVPEIWKEQWLWRRRREWLWHHLGMVQQLMPMLLNLNATISLSQKKAVKVKISFSCRQYMASDPEAPVLADHWWPLRFAAWLVARQVASFCLVFPFGSVEFQSHSLEFTQSVTW